MEQLRVKTCVRVEVNDNGDTINVYVGDLEYRNRFNCVLRAFDEISDKLHSREFQEMGEDERTDYMVEGMKNVAVQIDSVFGKGCCRKVFGDIVPSPDYVADFFREIKKILRKYDLERKKELAERYSADRKGAESRV